jgi:primary-amine oxidase
LVVSSVSTVENYEYGFFWYLYQDGNIQLEVKLTGILSLGAFRPDETPHYGSLVAPQVYGPNHQHFFNVRLDFDLDGMANTIQQVDVKADPEGDRRPRHTADNRETSPGAPEVGDGPHLEDHQPFGHQRGWPTGGL